eukprot:gene15475-17696_t
MSRGMMSNSLPNQSQSGGSTTVIIRKYFGRCVAIPRTDPDAARTIKKYLEVTQSVASTSKSFKNGHWELLERSVTDLGNFLVNPDIPLYRHQVELISDGLLQYLGNLKGRSHVDNNRFHQISVIIRAIMRSNTEHPAILLQEIDDVVAELRSGSRFNLWKSELLTALDIATTNQWQPIIADTRVALQDIGGKLLVLGLVGVVGWPVAFLYPMLKLSSSLMRIVNEYERTKRLTNQSIFDLVKTLVMLVASIQLLSILSAYTTMGYSCLLMSAVALTISSNNQSLKFAAPILAPHMEQMDQLISTASSVDLSRIINRGNQFMAQTQHPASAFAPSQATRSSNRVEVLPDQDTNESSGSTRSTNSSTSGTYARTPVARPVFTSSEVIDLTEAEVVTVDPIDNSGTFSSSGSERSGEFGLRRRT